MLTSVLVSEWDGCMSPATDSLATNLEPCTARPLDSWHATIAKLCHRDVACWPMREAG